MALITCPECNRQVSDTAKTCPCCGYKMNTEIVKRRKKTVIITMSLSLFIVLLVGVPIYSYYHSKAVDEAYEKYVDRKIQESLPQSYEEYRQIVSGLHGGWELKDKSDENIRNMHINISFDKINNVPFKESTLYKDWDSYIYNTSVYYTADGKRKYLGY